ncbi:hypothetical protein ACLB1G_01775 [Oxalobacteraceae bacterium A2-2]
MKHSLLTISIALLAWAPSVYAQQHNTMVIDSSSSEVMMLRLSATSRCQQACVVRDAPYSAERIIDNVRLLADGNRIARSSSEQLFRDSAGRSRVESTWLNQGLVQIQDPVQGYSYRLYPGDRSGIRMAISEPAASNSNGSVPPLATVSISSGASMVAEQLAPALAGAVAATDSLRSTRALGTRQIEGLTAEGTLVTTTLPAGKAGNTLPIVSTVETWHSAALKLDLYVKSVDPRYGETISRVQKIHRTEPSASLFTAPADYTVRDIQRR